MALGPVLVSLFVCLFVCLWVCLWLGSPDQLRHTAYSKHQTDQRVQAANRVTSKHKQRMCSWDPYILSNNTAEFKQIPYFTRAEWNRAFAKKLLVADLSLEQMLVVLAAQHILGCIFGNLIMTWWQQYRDQDAQIMSKCLPSIPHLHDFLLRAHAIS